MGNTLTTLEPNMFPKQDISEHELVEALHIAPPEVTPEVAESTPETVNPVSKMAIIFPDNAPDIQQVFAFRTMHILCDINKSKGTLRAIYYATVLQMGRSPTWGVFSVKTGKLLRFASSREQIGQIYPKYTWRQIHSKWNIGDLMPDYLPLKDREKELHKKGLSAC